MRKRLMLVAGILIVFVVLVLIVSSIGGIRQSTAREAGDSFASAFAKGDAKTMYTLFTPGMQINYPLKSTAYTNLQAALTKNKQQFKGSKPIYVRMYVSDTYPTDGFTVAEYNLNDTSHKPYVLDVVLSQQDNTKLWAVADYALNGQDTN